MLFLSVIVFPSHPPTDYLQWNMVRAEVSDIKCHILLKETDEQQNNLNVKMMEKQEELIHFILSFLSNLSMHHHSRSSTVYDFVPFNLFHSVILYCWYQQWKTIVKIRGSWDHHNMGTDNRNWFTSLYKIWPTRNDIWLFCCSRNNFTFLPLPTTNFW